MKSILLLSVLAIPCLAQPNMPPPVISPEVQADHRVTFRFRAPNVKDVKLSLEGVPKPMAMAKDDSGVWSYTSEPLEPDFYGYSFIADGVSLIDPMNHLRKPNYLWASSEVHVPGKDLPWEIADVPRGELHRHFYHSGIIGDDRDFFVYTPPGYDPAGKKKYPVFYLLHGYSDDASGWTAVGRAHIILDNLIAQGKAKPMLVVMTLGYGAPEIVSRQSMAFRDPGLMERNYTRYRDALFQEVMPAVEKEYKVHADRKSRAIAGLSMGGAESLLVGLNASEKFSAIGAFSMGGVPADYEKAFSKLDAKAVNQLDTLWIACGTEDGLITANRKLREWLKSKDIHPTEVETGGAHTWLVWRRNLATFAPLLFQK